VCQSESFLPGLRCKNLQKQWFLMHFLRQKSAFFGVLMQKMGQKGIFDTKSEPETT
jgi:hypothetical protein